MILILSQLIEPNTSEIIDILNFYNKPWFRLNGEDIPTNIHFEYDLNDGSKIEDVSGINSINILELDKVTSVWARRRGAITPSPHLPENQQRFVADECLTLYKSLESLTSAQWMNNPWCDDRANNPIVQLRIAKKVGLTIPNTTITQSKTIADRFYSACNGDVITKRIMKAPISHYGFSMVFTSPVTEEHAQEFTNLELCPTLLQSRVDRLLELRITVVGNKLFSAATEIDLQNKYKVDIRESDLQKINYFPYQLPESIQQKLLQFMTELGLVFGAIDMILTKNNEFVFIELNPIGQWGWVESATGLKITEAVAQWLMLED
ncbi:ATP-grasp domain-containing protein [Pseudoalteromonas byunsanensis]|uniref:ATP-grasp domain-containing protein n=1 Tax=Pseudoalteromonas byunsanensis TaxID=327939 RepID=A0A1S1N620_9GAMM|nr:hypothetical protein [Pseudoalteromonas byunsanensis]OHU96672.1 hypothetical protein BIW53_04925 [Pseudoalteromonas byunsanensis]